MNDRTNAVLAAIDGALMDPELPDGMRWSPEPDTVKDPAAVPYDGELVPIPHQHYEPGPDLIAYVRRREDEALDRITGRMQYRHRRAERIAADARAALPRVTVSPRPGLAPDLLIVDELGPGTVSVRPATDEEVADLLRDAYARFIEGVTPLVQQVGERFRRFGDALRNAGWAPTGPPTTPEARRAMGLPPLSPADVRAAALEARRSRPTGPAVVGPERAPGPRRGPSPATTRRGRQRPRQGRER